MSNRRFFWLKLNENFFHRNDIKLIEAQKNGAEYLIFYLKLLTESIERNGDLRFNELIAFNEDMLSTVTGTNIDVVRSALKLFKTLGLIEIKNDDTIYMIETAAMTGSETASTIRSRRHRAKKAEEEAEEQKKIETSENKVKQVETTGKNGKPLQCNTNATKCNVELELELDLELEKELELELERELELDLVSDFKNGKKALPIILNIFKKLKLKSNPNDFYNYWNMYDWKFNYGKGNQIKVRHLESLANRWESMEEKFKTQNIGNGGRPNIKKDDPKWLDEYIQEINEMEG